MQTSTTKSRVSLFVLLGLAVLLAVPACSESDTKRIIKSTGFEFDPDPASAFTRVDRMGMPAINTAVITSKDAYNMADPADDSAGTFVSEITSNISALHTALDDDLLALSLTPCMTSACVGQAAPLVVPDTIKIDTTLVAGFPNGRLLPDQVMDVTLALVLLDLSVHPVTLFASLPLNPPANDVTFNATFPYLASPHVP